MRKQTMGQYLGRAVRHLLKLTLIVGALFAIMYLTGTLGVEPAELLGTRGVILVVAMVAISALFPLYGFDTVVVEGSVEGDRRAIVEALARGGYGLVGCDGGVLEFRARGLAKRLRYVGGDDRIVVRSVGERAIEISGIRREVEQARFRIVGLIRAGE